MKMFYVNMYANKHAYMCVCAHHTHSYMHTIACSHYKKLSKN